MPTTPFVPAGQTIEGAMGGGELNIEPVRIAVVMPSTISDLAWSQALYDALIEIQDMAGGEDVVEIAFTENMFNVIEFQHFQYYLRAIHLHLLKYRFECG